MVRVAMHERRTKWARANLQEVRTFGYVLTELAELSRKRGQPVGFLDADVRDVADARRTRRERRDGVDA